MKVSLITILDNTNFGTYLQALALSKAIERLGGDVEIVDYIRPFMTRWGSMSSTRNPLKKLQKWFKYPEVAKLRDTDHDFLRKFVKLTSNTYHCYEEICEKIPMADIYMTGSDQVWNSVYNRGIDRTFYVDYAPTGAKRVAYAASIGMEDFPQDQLDATKQLLSKYDKITVRESKAQEILSKHGLKNPDIVLDPTLLLNSGDWGNISKEAGEPLDIQEPYLLVYSVETKSQAKLISHYAKSIAVKHGWKIYQVSYGDEDSRIEGVDKLFCRATPDVFLQLINYSQFMVVSSFHGTAFAVNFNKQFFSITPKRFNSRIQSLLDLLNLTERIISDSNVDIENINNVDFEIVNVKLAAEQQKSLNILRILCSKEV